LLRSHTDRTADLDEADTAALEFLGAPEISSRYRALDRIVDAPTFSIEERSRDQIYRGFVVAFLKGGASR